jgi:transcription elongation factor GreA-like protein
LPVSLGLEYGLNLKWSFEGKTKIKQEQKVGGTSTTQEYYTSDRVAGNFSKLHQREFGMDTNNNVRILLNVYFGK